MGNVDERLGEIQDRLLVAQGTGVYGAAQVEFERRTI